MSSANAPAIRNLNRTVATVKYNMMAMPRLKPCVQNPMTMQITASGYSAAWAMPETMNSHCASL
jgi:hypothetical protein